MDGVLLNPTIKDSGHAQSERTHQYGVILYPAHIFAGQSEGFSRPRQPQTTRRFQPYPVKDFRPHYNRLSYQVQDCAYPWGKYMPDHRIHYYQQGSTLPFEFSNQASFSDFESTAVATGNRVDLEKKVVLVPCDTGLMQLRDLLMLSKRIVVILFHSFPSSIQIVGTWMNN